MIYSELAKAYKKNYGFNVLPVQGKRPTIVWENWQIIEQSENDIESLGWDDTITGIGGICGINDLRNLDFDKVVNEKIVEMILNELGLTTKYEWIVRSGSQAGFHIWLKVRESEMLHKSLNGPKSVYRLKLKEDGFCDHIELRWNKSQTILPYSQHESGNKYSFLYNDPIKPPIEVEPNVLLECFGRVMRPGKRKGNTCNRKENI